MPTCPNQPRAKHRDRIGRLVLPAAVAFGLSFTSSVFQPLDCELGSVAQAQGPQSAKKKVEPRIFDFGKLAKQKAEARKLLDAARKSAVKGDADTARRLADQAAAIPVEWNLGEISPKKILDELTADPARFTDAPSETDSSESSRPQRRTFEIDSSTSSASSAPEVIEIDLPQRPAASSAKSSAKSPSKSRYAAIPTVEELAAPATDADLSANASPASVSSANVSSAAVADLNAKHATSAKRSSDPSTMDAQAIQQLSSSNDTIPSGRLEETNSVVSSNSNPNVSSAPFAGLRSQPQGHDLAATVPSTTTVIHEFRVAERTAAVDQSANANSSIASQLLLNINSLMMAGLFGALVLLVGVAVAVLRKFGPNPEFTFKVELNQPLGFAAAAASTVAAVAAPMAVEPIVKTPVPPIHVTPIYALKRQMAEELEQQQEDAMMRQVFEENLKLREQIEETRIAA